MGVYLNDVGWSHLYKAYTGHGLSGDVAVTLAAWARAKNVTENHPIITICVESFKSQGYSISMRGDENDKVKSQENTLGLASSGTFVANTWYHVAAVFEAGANGGRSVYINGTETSAITTVSSPTPDFMQIGYYEMSGNHSAEADIAEISVWTSALSDAAIADLATGKVASYYPTNLHCYHRLLTDYTDEKGGATLIAYGTPVLSEANHPTMIEYTSVSSPRPGALDEIITVLR